MGKGDKARPIGNREEYGQRFEAVFGRKPLNVMTDEEREALLREQAELAKLVEEIPYAEKG